MANDEEIAPISFTLRISLRVNIRFEMSVKINVTQI